MGKIQSAITGLVMASLGAVKSPEIMSALKGGDSGSAEATVKKQKPSNNGNNIQKRQQEANKIAKQYSQSRTKQKKDFQERRMKFKGKRITVVRKGGK